MSQHETLGECLKRHREMKGLSVRELAKLTDKNHSYVLRAEDGVYASAGYINDFIDCIEMNTDDENGIIQLWVNEDSGMKKLMNKIIKNKKDKIIEHLQAF